MTTTAARRLNPVLRITHISRFANTPTVILATGGIVK